MMNDRKKLLFVVESLAGGGAEKVLLTILKNINKKKYDITVLTVVKTGVYINEIKNYCRLRYMLPDLSELSTIKEKLKYKIDYQFIYHADIKKVYQKYVHEKYDVEVAFLEGFATKFIIASFNQKSKKICWIHIDMLNNPYADNAFKSLEEEKKVYEKYDEIIAVSETVKKIFEKKFHIVNKAKVIYNPIDSKEILSKAQSKKILDISDSKINLISIGRVEHQKGFDRLIGALGKIGLKEKYHLYILGNGSQINELKKLVEKMELSENVSLLGFQENPYPWIEACDVLLCTSRAEGYSLVIAEAMILEKPVISVDCAGPNELLNYGEYGVLIPNSDEEIKQILMLLLDGKIDLKRYKSLSRKRKDFFIIDTIINEIEGIFDR